MKKVFTDIFIYGTMLSSIFTGLLTYLSNGLLCPELELKNDGS